MRQPKRKYAVLLGGKLYATTWAVSAKKAIANVWWKLQKQGDKYKDTDPVIASKRMFDAAGVAYEALTTGLSTLTLDYDADHV